MNCFAYSSIIYEKYLALIIGEISYKKQEIYPFPFDDMKVKTPIYLSYCSPDMLKNLFSVFIVLALSLI